MELRYEDSNVIQSFKWNYDTNVIHKSRDSEHSTLPLTEETPCAGKRLCISQEKKNKTLTLCLLQAVPKMQPVLQINAETLRAKPGLPALKYAPLVP